MTRDLNYSKLTLCRLQTVSATARGKVYQVNLYSWSVHPARRRRTDSITVTVRNAHSMVSSSTSESDSLPVSSACKAQRWYESQSRRLNNEGEKIFSALRADAYGSALRASMHCLPHCQSQYEIASYGPAQYQHPPFNIPRTAPVHVDLDCL